MAIDPKNKRWNVGDSIHTYFCPSCQRKLISRDLETELCPNCGQSLAIKDPVAYNNQTKKMDNYRWNRK